MEDTYEVLVIGGGPAGLTAVLSLARYDCLFCMPRTTPRNPRRVT